MNIRQKLSMALAYKCMSQKELANRYGTSQQNFRMKIVRNTLTKEDLEKIASALGAKWVCYFEFPDGTKI